MDKHHTISSPHQDQISSDVLKQLDTHGIPNDYRVFRPILSMENEDLFTGYNNLMSSRGKILMEPLIVGKLIHFKDEDNSDLLFHEFKSQFHDKSNIKHDFYDPSPDKYQDTKSSTQYTVPHPLTDFENHDKLSNHLLGYFKLGSLLTGHKGVIHGGMIATLIDEFFCRCGFQVLGIQAVTANIQIDYLRPILLTPEQQDDDPSLESVEIVISCYIESISANFRKCKMKGCVYNPITKEKYAMANLLVVKPREWIA